MALSADERTLAIGNSDGSITLFETASGQVRRQLFGHREACLGLAFSPTAPRLISTSSDHTALVWDVALKTIIADAKPAAGAPLAALWDKLDTANAQEALPLLAAFLAAPKEAAALLADRLRLVPASSDAFSRTGVGMSR